MDAEDRGMSDTDKLVEAVARAIAAHAEYVSDEDLTEAMIDHRWCHYVPAARSSIAAIKSTGFVLVPVRKDANFNETRRVVIACVKRCQDVQSLRDWHRWCRHFWLL